ncbi:MAG: site-2 protease family protein [Candidatus Cloacimonetes bacterium]|jgi:Zn-dependent protease|nr:site-2 protease family protein [Candidatus Cloacimonadota bacterium]MDY0366087.1 site-2 protease family protein [Candidatus Syntrophosphaera sp.]HOY84994.1 site-2 protease family protein [Candidatus Syntrophosphaera sp.]HPH60570.1 site-2 protease family protein [Candidatus Syntrophosphaera sp.]
MVVSDKTIEMVLTGIIILIVFYSIIIHEVSHAVVSFWLGDDTAKRAGRLSLNPLKHIDWFGTVILPLIMYFTAGVIWGYAKPVPLNPYNYKNIKQGIGLSALAGPASNLLIAIVFALLYHLSPGNQLLAYIFQMVVFFNLLLAFFNLIPVPPLDGSKVLGMVLPDDAYWRWMAQERTGMYVLFGILIVSRLLNLNIIGRLILPPINLVMGLLGVA